MLSLKQSNSQYGPKEALVAFRQAIAAALTRVKIKAQGNEQHIIKSSLISRSDRELLTKTNWLLEIIRGWYLLVRPDILPGDTTSWYANYWDFIHVYLEDRFGDNYCLSAESSLDLHTQNPTIPQQLIVISNAGNSVQDLLYDTSIMIYEDKKNFPTEIEKLNGINVMPLPLAICKVTPRYFQKNPRNAELALRLIKTPSDLINMILKHELKSAAARIIGAYQFLQNDQFSTQIRSSLESLGILVNPSNPFPQEQPLLGKGRLTSPYSGRITAMWHESRQSVIDHLPQPPGLPNTKEGYLHELDEIYSYDAYNSLSIEGYQVSKELIERVKNNDWNPDYHSVDEIDRNAMAARGYFDAFQEVKRCVAEILSGANSADIVAENHQLWYSKLFGPSAQAGILPREKLFGYRDDRVYIRNSLHTPPPKEAVLDAMEAFQNCLKNEEHPGVRAVLGHYIFVYIHPYMDGNGRMGRFIMNALLAGGGYPWTVVRVKSRNRYITTLEETHTNLPNLDLSKFTQFIVEEMNARGND